MNIQIGLPCKYETTCTVIGWVLAFLLFCFVAYLVYAVIKKARDDTNVK